MQVVCPFIKIFAPFRAGKQAVTHFYFLVLHSRYNIWRKSSSAGAQAKDRIREWKTAGSDPGDGAALVGVNPQRKECGEKWLWRKPGFGLHPSFTCRICHHSTQSIPEGASLSPSRHSVATSPPWGHWQGWHGQSCSRGWVAGGRRQHMHLHTDWVIACGRYQTGLCMHNYPICIGDNCLGESGAGGCYPGLVRLLIERGKKKKTGKKKISDLLMHSCFVVFSISLIKMWEWIQP